MISRDDLRIGDAERDEVTATLREHFAQGRLTREELDERLDAAFAARTAGELRRVTADLPASPAPRPAPYDAPPSAHARRGRGAWGHGPRPGGHHGWHPGPLPWAGEPQEWTTGGAPVPWAGPAALRRMPGAHHGRTHRHHGRPPIPLIVAAVVLFAAVAAGSLAPLLFALKVALLIGLVVVVARLVRHRHPRRSVRARRY
ncbi:hypothetical protein Sme01_07880 [Sphaerisporangium melleum]|uniref:DUF1707 domain-containing protein n=1 Tax=Sphaerisporangium melleum TaxID=321316 RepID=A0A917QWQ8_9ACTN|nr:DUF1707 domain-containing protein [Sphaerisporangium melleum]GGK72668.1 hypothetical protein GCM10007964_14310 [Sphaerisporangium melleum]GII68312.1 hypothetical protein Sme01_07880 [Sphaerisporangium melleum]